MATKTRPAELSVSSTMSAERHRIFEPFRRWGYLAAQLDPLGQYLPPEILPELEEAGALADEARRFYCGTVGVEFMHLPDAHKRQWILERMERASAPARSQPSEQQRRILTQLIQADVFEQVVQSRYLGNKRFSLEGVTALIPFLNEILEGAAERGAVQSVIGMSHRGRLNVMVNIVGRSPADVFSKFEDVNPRSCLGGGDVKYHVGATGRFVSGNGAEVDLHLVSNPSHLEAVDPVVMGRARAKQARFAGDGLDRVLPVLIHGDAAFAGQGIWAETLNLSQIRGYSVGGGIQVIVNNLIGFTAEPGETNSSRFASDLAKRLEVPIFHVNGEDPEAVVRIAAMAVEYRYAFHTDVVVDILGYRRHGHSEVDDPTITQPLRYAIIKDHPPLYEIYARRIGVDPAQEVAQAHELFAVAQKQASRMTHRTSLATLPAYWAPYHGGAHRPEDEVDTGITPERMEEIGRSLTSYPGSFHVHPKIQKLLEQRAEMSEGKRAIDFGMAEALAFGSLLREGTAVRLSGQDSQRGTFSHRHSVLIDVENEQRYTPLAHLSSDQARVEIYNSPLSEAAALGYEYGYSRDAPETLVLWEAQFGDFANGAQVITDQFITSGEDKWGLLNAVVVLLPHGYEGQGPEHSSARIERYLQLAARDNIQICQPSTAAQYFHLLRRQARRPWRKPLIVFTPKSMLRHPEASSPRDAFSAPRFQTVLPETEIADVRRLLIASGKIGRELRMERAKRTAGHTGIVFLEQLYPWPENELGEEIARHAQAREIVWVQEEPANMGALSFVVPRLRRLAPERTVLSVKRSAAASPATGSAKAHALEQKTLLTMALHEDRG